MAAAMCALFELMRLSDVYLRCSSGVAVSLARVEDAADRIDDTRSCKL